MRGKITADMAEAQSQMEGQLGLMLEHLDTATKPLLDEAERIKRRARGAGGARSRARRAPGGVETPPSNRGVRSQTKPPAKTKKTTRTTRGNHGPV
jgi:hypothetical protein